MSDRRDRDPYEVLQVSPNAHPLIIAKAYRLLAALYHPDNRTTGDPERFREVVAAYALLSDAGRRAVHDRFRHDEPSTVGVDGRSEPPERAPHDERELRALILQTLYNTRRTTPARPSVPLHVIADLGGCTVEELQFTIWYLRGKRLIETFDGGEVAITVDGVDFVEAQGIPDAQRMLADGVGEMRTPLDGEAADAR
jgi:curved DNA-binding protein CbpA